MNEQEKEHVKTGIVCWIVLGVIFLNIFVICPYFSQYIPIEIKDHKPIPYEEMSMFSKIISFLALCLLEILLIPVSLFLGGFLFCLLYPIIFLVKEIDGEKIVLFILFILLALSFCFIGSELYKYDRTKSNLPDFSFQIGEKVFSKIDPQKTEGIVISRKYANSIKKSSSFRIFTPFYYEVRFPVADEQETLFRIELLAEFELERSSDFINYEK